jgi:DNA-binding response OmpR family regulator
MADPLILVAEDERDIRELIVFTMQIAGLRVVDVPNGEEALKKAQEVVPDLILMDVRMPKMTGFEACKALKKEDKTKNIPIIFLSAKGQENEISMGRELGAEDYFLKPFAPDDLVRRVNKVLTKFGKL